MPPPVGVCLAGLAEPFQVHLMADAVTGTGEVDTVLGRYGLQVTMVVCIFKTGLQGVVVYIGNTQFCLYPVNAHGFQFQVGHRTGGILGQGLVDSQGNLVAGNHLTVYQVGSDDFLCDCHSHFKSPPTYAFWRL